jgi:RNA-directed DNA polymerase
MEDSNQRQRKQKTSYGGCPEETGLETRRVLEAQSLELASCKEKAKRTGDTEQLLERIVSRSNMNAALKRVVRNKGSHGIDGMQVDELRPYLMEHGRTLVETILEGRFNPNPVKRVMIPKPDGGERALGIPIVVDRVVQQAINQVLSEVFEPKFSEHSYGFRPNKSAHMALLQAKSYINEGYRYVCDIDLEKFFDRVNHDKLMSLIAREVSDKRVLKLIRAYLTAGVMDKGIKVKSTEGAPQGGPLSPLLSNIMLNELDKELERRGHKFCRCADDCNIYVISKRAGERVMKSVKKFLEDELRLKVNEGKSAVASPTRRKFLGYSFYFTKRGVNFRVHKTSIDKFKDKIRKITNRNVSMNFEHRVKRLLEVTRGWINYFKLANMKALMRTLDEWTRRRLRACIWKTWKRVRTRFRNLVKLGIPKSKALEFANTRKGYWRISNSPILSCSITNERLIKRGYISLTSLYQKYAV